MEQYQQRNLELDRQPVGVSGEALGVMGVMVLKLTIEGNNTTFNVPCHVLQSSKPMWNGDVYDCALVLGTNALETLGFRITNPNGEPSWEKIPVSRSPSSGTRRCRCKGTCLLDQQLCLGLFQSKIVKAGTNNTSSDLGICIKMVIPNDKLASSYAM